MAPPKGAQYTLKLRDPDVRQDAFNKYCEWLSFGKAIKSFHYTDGKNWITGETMENYIKNNPGEFSVDRRDHAWAQGYAYWEKIVDDLATGKNKTANTASLNMLMRNKYQWDRFDLLPNSGKSEQVEFAIREAKKIGTENNIKPEPDQRAKAVNGSP